MSGGIGVVAAVIVAALVRKPAPEPAFAGAAELAGT